MKGFLVNYRTWIIALALVLVFESCLMAVAVGMWLYNQNRPGQPMSTSLASAPITNVPIEEAVITATELSNDDVTVSPGATNYPTETSTWTAIPATAKGMVFVKIL